MSSRSNAGLFWTAAVSVIALDIVTKQLATTRLIEHVPHRIAGDVVRFTLAHNPGAAFSMSLGPNSRYIFGAFALVALVILFRLFRLTKPGDVSRTLALGLAWRRGQFDRSLPLAARRGGLHRHRCRRRSLLDVQRRGFGGHGRRADARVGVVARGSSRARHGGGGGRGARRAAPAIIVILTHAECRGSPRPRVTPSKTIPSNRLPSEWRRVTTPTRSTSVGCHFPGLIPQIVDA